ncbi:MULTISPECIES: adenosylmethionine--8-amino-7-oxononanoate transaminase [unclassified Pseudodesulfovibrio]|uniref:adenosylmethionine--8-amino-7-oxononanoate transaminase n=1 Tax=unclassified Pseudodesulfovibrio TaxID=2661612 RepID=UPI000FEBC87B|nr:MULTISPECIES: adenosylmethionine--8-amino-7-oxononanoate transaminase [unclassified Pseudodesulfovibrio]MCJ2166050.1 adenosylmethionine--8-amino-7-oxononanoate transaminase [Pseudodesulfovibrio sp. S3-i]RWU02495.1 adenosylmethionine--8-amino-7-oxononanoate transaminase [Pseudodesulfovibrio sp. S3]
MKGYFITGTDTGVGKTCVCAGLLRALADAGHKALAVKPVQTGCVEKNNVLVAEDVLEYARLNVPHFPGGYPDACCRKYVPACSPHLAAKRAGDSLVLDQLVQEICNKGRNHDLILVEGAGGVAVPLNDGQTMLDLMHRLFLPVIIVADNRLGMINHTLMTIEAVRNRGLNVAGVVVTNTSPSRGGDLALRADNIAAIARHGDVAVLADIPFAADQGERDRQVVCLLAQAVDRLPSVFKSTNEDLAFDRDHLWHPYTSATNPLPTVKVRSAHGTRIVLDDGSELIDGMASWWCAIHGYGHPELERAMRSQIGRMSHVMFGGLTHEPAVELGRRLVGMTPEGLDHVFLADSGSVSVEVAIKMAMQYMQANGQSGRTRLLTVRGGYHGDTCGAMSVCDPHGGMHHVFSNLLPKQVFAPRPDCRFDQPFDPGSLQEITRLLEKHSHEVAAIIIEPIVQGAGGMHFYHPEYLRALRGLADRHGVLLIADEIATGFGRTGKLFGCDWAGIAPDIMCVGKALSGGTMTIAATLSTSEVARTVSADGGVLMHGPTFMGNPLACAVSVASLDLLARSDWQSRVGNIEMWLNKALLSCRDLPGVADVRTLGAIGVVEMCAPVNVTRLQEFFVRNGVWLRPFGKLIYMMPPYSISEEEIVHIGSVVAQAIDQTTNK